MGLQSCKSFNFANLKQNDIWVLVLWLGTKYIIRGKVVASPSPCRGEFCESMFAHGLSVHQRCSSYTLINLLFGLYRSVWIIVLLVNHLNLHLKALARASTPKVMRARKRASIPFPYAVFILQLTIESIKKLGGMSPIFQNYIIHTYFNCFIIPTYHIFICRRSFHW